MASNDGRTLAVFGLTFRQHDNRQMQQILRQYGRLPSNPGNRAALFTGLFDLSRDLENDEAQGIEVWLRNGGNPDNFPQPRPATPTAVPMEEAMEGYYSGAERDVETEDEEEWPEYNPNDFEDRDTDMEDADLQDPFDETSSEELNIHNELLEQTDMESFPEGAQLDNLGQGGDVAGDFDTDFDLPKIQYKEPDPVENECSVCYEGKESADLLAPLKITSTCDHDTDRKACFQCLEQHITLTVKSGDLVYLNCPFCDEKMSPDEIEKYASADAFSRYEYLILVSNPDIVMCLGPSCGSGQIHTDSTDPKMICNTCSFATCAHHKLPWHEGQTCEEFDCDDTQIERLEQAEATAKLLTKDQSKICPSCKQGVTKQDGCDHLTCRCGKSWCFLCLASWDNIMRIGQEAHAPTCDYHPRKLQKSKAQQAAGQVHMTETLLGGPASEALLRARDARNERVRAELRPKAAEAAEARMKAELERAKEGGKNESPEKKRRRVRLLPAWEER